MATEEYNRERKEYDDNRNKNKKDILFTSDEQKAFDKKSELKTPAEESSERNKPTIPTPQSPQPESPRVYMSGMGGKPPELQIDKPTGFDPSIGTYNEKQDELPKIEKENKPLIKFKKPPHLTKSNIIGGFKQTFDPLTRQPISAEVDDSFPEWDSLAGEKVFDDSTGDVASTSAKEAIVGNRTLGETILGEDMHSDEVPVENLSQQSDTSLDDSAEKTLGAGEDTFYKIIGRNKVLKAKVNRKNSQLVVTQYGSQRQRRQMKQKETSYQTQSPPSSPSAPTAISNAETASSVLAKPKESERFLSGIL